MKIMWIFVWNLFENCLKCIKKNMRKLYEKYLKCMLKLCENFSETSQIYANGTWIVCENYVKIM